MAKSRSHLCGETLEPLKVVQRLEAGAGEGLPGYPMYLCSETLELLEAVQRLEAGAGEGLPGYPDGGPVL